MEKEMEMVDNIIIIVNYHLKENIYTEKSGMERDII